jgi:hypothetical protein
VLDARKWDIIKRLKVSPENSLFPKEFVCGNTEEGKEDVMNLS